MKKRQKKKKKLTTIAIIIPCHVTSLHLLDPGLLVIQITVELVQSIRLIQFLVTICGHVLYPTVKQFQKLRIIDIRGSTSSVVLHNLGQHFESLFSDFNDLI